MQTHPTPDTPEDYCGTTYAAKLLGLSVGTIQTLVEKSELQAWKTQGGHRRISMPSIRDYQKKHNMLMSSGENREYRLRVLLVEDDPVTRDMLKDFCNRCEMPVDCTAMSSGLEALIDMASIQPDVLIADLNMPGVDGFELLRRLRQDPQTRELPVVMITSRSADKHREYALQLGATAYLGKPFNESELLALLKQLCTENIFRTEQLDIV